MCAVRCVLCQLVVSRVLPECSLPEDTVQAGELISKVNGQEVGTLSQLRAAIDGALKGHSSDDGDGDGAGDKGSARGGGQSGWLTVETTENSLMVFDLSKVETRVGRASHAVGRQFSSMRGTHYGRSHGRHRHRRRRRRGGRRRRHRRHRRRHSRGRRITKTADAEAPAPAPSASAAAPAAAPAKVAEAVRVAKSAKKSLNF
jgi:hypothetical protein